YMTMSIALRTTSDLAFTRIGAQSPVLAHLIFFCQAEDGIRDRNVTGVQTCALPISLLPTDVIREWIYFISHKSNQAIRNYLVKMDFKWEKRKIFSQRADTMRSEEHTSELQSRFDLVCRLLLEKKKT